MDQRSPAEDLTELMATWADNVLSRVRIAVPVKLTKDSDGHTVEAQPQIQGLALQPDGTTKFMDLPSFADLPINHHGGGGITITHPHKEGDEGIALMTQQAFDVWFKKGGVQQPGDVRMHSLADAFYLPGVRNQTRKLENISTTSTQMRSDDGKHFYDLHPKDGAKVSIENAKHVMTFHPTKGIAASVENGKHVMNIDPSAGFDIKTLAKLAMTATQGMALTGNFNVTGNIGASGSIGAPALQGILSAFAGAALAVLMMLGAQAWLAPAGDPSTASQSASYVRAALARSLR